MLICVVVSKKKGRSLNVSTCNFVALILEQLFLEHGDIPADQHRDRARFGFRRVIGGFNHAEDRGAHSERAHWRTRSVHSTKRQGSDPTATIGKFPDIVTVGRSARETERYFEHDIKEARRRCSRARFLRA